MNGKDWLHDQKWGIFTHFLHSKQNNPIYATNMGMGETNWNEMVNGLDVKRLASDIHKAGAHYLVFTTMQCERYMCAPNDTYNQITGYKPGEACADRDLIGDIIDALRPYDISLMLYYTGDGPYKDSKAGLAMGYVSQQDKVTNEYVHRWASVAKDYSLRYGSDVKGWWVDGCFKGLGYNDDNISIYVPALKAGNPDSVLAFNEGPKKRVFKHTIHDDFTCGEMTSLNSFIDIPDSRFIDEAQWHTLAPLGIAPKEVKGAGLFGPWCEPGCIYSAKYVHDYIHKVNEKGGVVSVDVALYRDGHIDPEQVALLRQVYND